MERKKGRKEGGNFQLLFCSYQLIATCGTVLFRALLMSCIASRRARHCLLPMSSVCFPVRRPLANGAHPSTITPSSLQQASSPCQGGNGNEENGVIFGLEHPEGERWGELNNATRTLVSGARRKSENSISLKLTGIPRFAILAWNCRQQGHQQGGVRTRERRRDGLCFTSLSCFSL